MGLERAVGLAFVVALVVIASGLILVGLATYNDVVALGQRIDKAWANIGVALQQRHDELPDLVAAVRGETSFEREVLDEVTRLRAAYAPTAPLPEQAATSEATTAAVHRLLADVEAYPTLKAQANVAGLQAEIARLEDILAARRELYNEMVYRYDTRIARLPALLLAGICRWAARPYFATDPETAVRPEVRLG
ncbi:MAG TPA: LemA family protein [Candidatus Limnocylindrales bacterium]|nr:LemA family protein [Candidatus Limnocylindrales bacterium]